MRFLQLERTRRPAPLPRGGLTQVKAVNPCSWFLIKGMNLAAPHLALLLVAVCTVALLYSSVGHGGATGYLAVMALLSIAPAIARPGALWMNCVVASVAFWRFHRAGYFDVRLFSFLALASIPMAWTGSRMALSSSAASLVLGAALVIAGWLLGWGNRRMEAPAVQRASIPMAITAGAGLGFLAGVTGIGGGVYLTPLLIVLGWASAKTAAGISALFIVVNSIAGLAGLGSRALVWQPAMPWVLLAGIVGALIGTHFSVRKWNLVTFRKVLGGVLFTAAAKCLFSSSA